MGLAFFLYALKLDINKLDDKKLANLIENRWVSSETIWDTIKKVYEQNTAIYENKAKWLERLPVNKPKVQANRIFTNTESVINSLIANPAAINFVPTRQDAAAKEFAKNEEMYFQRKFADINFKETVRMALRNMYFGRLLVIKAFWNAKINDFDFRAIDPRKVRIAKHAKCEDESEFAIEEVTDTVLAVCSRFPKKKDAIVERFGMKEDDLYIKNPEMTYKEAWIGDYLICKYQDIILEKVRNPYWDWDGLLVTKEEQAKLEGEQSVYGKDRRAVLNDIRVEQSQRQIGAMTESDGVLPPNEGHSEPITYESYYFNYFDQPRKPYVLATVFNNEDAPIGRTDMITLSATLQEGIDRRKQDIHENCELVNGTVLVDASVMDKSDAQQMRFEARGVVWGKGVANGVKRLTGEPLPPMVFEDMQDSRNEIDNIMAASSAFRGEREGSETKAGRLALIQQSALRLNELVQVVDYVSSECFKWAYQLAKTRYTEEHYAKWMGKDEAVKILGFIQDDFQTGTEIQVIPGKTLPQDAQFRFERAQKDVETGIISPVDYLEEAGYQNPKQLAQNAETYKLNPPLAVGLTPEQLQEIAPNQTEEKPPSTSISFKDLPPTGKAQLASLAGIQLDPNELMAIEQQQEMERVAKLTRPSQLETIP